MRELTKETRRRREILHLANERALSKVESDFARWRSGEIDAFELSDRIHKFHNGTARELFQQFSATNWTDWTLARAIVDGNVTEAEAGPELLAALATAMREIRENLARQ